jgi:Zinc finger, C2H2 type
LQSANQPWPALNNNLPSGAGNEYSSHLLSAALPISLQHLLKYSENIKKENGGGGGYNNALNLGMNEASSGFNFNLKNGNLNLAAALGLNQEVSSASAEVVVPTVTKRAKAAKPRTRNPPAVKKPRERKKKAPKERKPRPKPGEIRETTALDGSKLYLCPECQTAYPDRTLVEQHLASHQVERRFICDICDAALKRKDHLSRHKLSHSQGDEH